ncbi:2044_t:CDS:2, partial [Ambispora gerdemannii]
MPRTRATKSNTKVNIGQTIHDGGVRKRATAATKMINNFALSDSDEYTITSKPRARKNTTTKNRNNAKTTTTATTKTYNTRSKAKGQKSKKNTSSELRNQRIAPEFEEEDYNYEHSIMSEADQLYEEDDDLEIGDGELDNLESSDINEIIGLLQSKQRMKSNTRFHKFEYEQDQRLDEAINKIDGEGGILNNWLDERHETIIKAKRKMDDCLAHKEDNIKNFKFGFEKYQSSTTKTLEHLTKLHDQSMKFRSELDNGLKNLYEKDEYELNEALNHFFKIHKRARKSFLITVKEDHNIMALKRRLS